MLGRSLPGTARRDALISSAIADGAQALAGWLGAKLLVETRYLAELRGRWAEPRARRWRRDPELCRLVSEEDRFARCASRHRSDERAWLAICSEARRVPRGANGWIMMAG